MINNIKYELEIKFDGNFPNTSPQFVYRDAIKKLLGDFQLDKLLIWTPDSSVVDIVDELKVKIQETLNKPFDNNEQQFEPDTAAIENLISGDSESKQTLQDQIRLSQSDEYITPDLNAYPEDPNFEEYIHQPDIINESVTPILQDSHSDFQEDKQKEISEELESESVEISTELGLIQQYYTFERIGNNPADLQVYITITISQTFIIGVNFENYPNDPIIAFPDPLKKILGNPYDLIKSLKNWNAKKPTHIIEVLHEIEEKLFFIKDIEQEAKKIRGEYKYDMISDSLTQLNVHLVTYGFKEYVLSIDLQPYPKPPTINLTPELQTIIQSPLSSLTSYKNWKEKESEPIEIVREISWLVDKNSRINFEIELLKENYKNITYDPTAETLKLEMKGKMKTQDITFEFQINLPRDYPMKIPEIKVLNEFELETHEKIKSDLQASFSDFFNEWTPFSYLIDLFNLISKKIFEVSVVSCVICHKIECPTCQVKIAGPEKESCHVDCPYCERSYHKHCWEQTIKSFGKCGFCLKIPPPEMIP